MTAADWIAAVVLCGITGAVIVVGSSLRPRRKGVEPVSARAMQQLEREVAHPNRDGTA